MNIEDPDLHERCSCVVRAVRADQGSGLARRECTPLRPHEAVVRDSRTPHDGEVDEAGSCGNPSRRGDRTVGMPRLHSTGSTRAAESEVRRMTLPSGSSTMAAYGPAVWAGAIREWYPCEVSSAQRESTAASSPT